MSYQQFVAEHERIDTALVRLLNQVDAVKHDTAGTVLALTTLADELRVHLAHEDSFLYPGLIDDGQHRFARVAAEFVRTFADLRDDWTRYLAQWDAASIRTDRVSFRADTHVIAARLTERIRCARQIYAAALQESVIPLRAPAARDAA